MGVLEVFEMLGIPNSRHSELAYSGGVPGIIKVPRVFGECRAFGVSGKWSCSEFSEVTGYADYLE